MTKKDVESCLTKKVCLIAVDDDPEFLDILESVVDSLPFHEIITLSSIEEARLIFKPEAFSVILLDLMVGGSFDDSIAFTKEIRQMDNDIIIVVITGFIHLLEADDADLMDAIDYFVEKPYDPRFLRNRLFAWAFHHRDRKECNHRFDEINKSIIERFARLDDLGKEITKKIENGNFGNA